ncbi:MAG: hypothetical protein JO013_16450 [Alphaproteobacteria bacterium]|nr:hypothetical protein [Alphaproteobacteria bacterium]MBV9932517.1 hypothetical protein [Alphaproteobacteria bacterium]
MRYSILLATAAMALLGSGEAVAAKKGGEQVAPEDKMICRSESLSESRIARRKVCRTKQEWSMLQRQREEDADDAKQNTYNQTLQPVQARPD